MGTFKKYVTYIMTLFIPFTCVTLCQLYSITSPMLLKVSNYGIRKINIFSIYLTASKYYVISKEVEKLL